MSDTPKKVTIHEEGPEDIVGHPLPGSAKMGGNLTRLRAAAAQA